MKYTALALVEFGCMLAKYLSDCSHRVHRRAALTGMLALAGAGGCSRGPEVIYRVRLTFHFKCPIGSKSFSGVWEIRESTVSAFPNPGSNGLQALIGEAIAMPFDNGRVAFALLVDYGGSAPADAVGLFSWNAATALAYAYQDAAIWAKPDGMDASALRLATPSAPARVPPKYVPALVTFNDLADPKTGRLLDPKDLSSVTGPGCVLDHVEIQLVDDPPTRGATRFLPWIGSNADDPSEPSWNNFLKHPEYFVRKAPSW